MISPLCTNCHDITVILFNVALNTINLIFYLQRHIPTILFSNSWRTQYIIEQWEFFEINLNHRRILKLNYVGNFIE
jgi:predicted HNH restriction endonuclease